MKKVIGHRGAAGLGLENSLAAIKAALATDVAALEIDVRLTRDHRLVVCHDADLVTMANNTSKISQHSWEELKNLPLRDQSQLLLLEEVLKLAGKRQLVVEAKDLGSEHALLAAFKKFPKVNVAVASFKRPILLALRKLKPELPLYVLEHTNVREAIHFAHRQKLQGIGLNFWLLNPVAYQRARRANLAVYVYTVNNRFLAWFLQILYPNVAICTDHPERFKESK